MAVAVAAAAVTAVVDVVVVVVAAAAAAVSRLGIGSATAIFSALKKNNEKTNKYQKVVRKNSKYQKYMHFLAMSLSFCSSGRE